MFTGIIESIGTLQEKKVEGSNIHFTFASSLTPELQIDQSVAHNGVCLTVVALTDETYQVTAVEETLQKTNLGGLAIGDPINLERCVQLHSRLDGHIVQGHVDATGTCISVRDRNGSWEYRFSFDPEYAGLVIPKGSISINGVSLTVVEPTRDSFGVAIIPYTYEHTNFHKLQEGDIVNLEFDILGKYILRNLELREK